MKNDSQIRSVEIKKDGRFWALSVNNSLLGIVLYRKGAQAIQQTIQRLAGLPVAVPDDEKKKEPKQAGPPRQPKRPAVKTSEKTGAKAPAAKAPQPTPTKETSVTPPTAAKTA